MPLIRTNTLKNNPGIEKILNEIDKKLTTRELRLLNKKVDVDGQNYQKVAQDWLKQNY